MSRNFILENHLYDESDVPLYYQIMGIIKRGIAANILKPGDMLPSETELCNAYGISRSTIRQALANLEKEGLIYRRRGKGTYISTPKLKRKLDSLYNFTSEMREQGLEPKSKILEFKKITGSFDLIKTMRLMENHSQVFKIVRIRLANDEPLLLETTFIPVYLCSQLTKQALTNRSLYHILMNEYKVQPYYATETYEPIILKGKEAEMLNCKLGTTGYFVERIGYLENKEVFEYTQSLVRGDRCKFQVELYKDSVKFSRKINKENY